MRILNLNRRTITLLIITLTLTILQSCDSSKLKPTSMDNFKGVWELQGRSMFNGIKIKIDENNQGELTGKVIELNDNKYVNMFVEINDTWISSIKRSSNFEFNLTEKKIGSALFSIYGLSTTTQFKVQFIDQNTIGLSNNGDPTSSTINYKRLK